MTDAAPVGGPDLFRLVRYWSRRWAAGVVAQAGDQTHVQQVQVVEAISAAVSEPGEDATVVEIARQLGVDRSVASRMIGDAASAGYVRRQTSAQDARRVGISLTDSGADLLASAHRWQQHTFEGLIAHWPAADRRRFAQYLHRLATEVTP